MISLKSICLLSAVLLAASAATTTQISSNWSKHGSFIQRPDENDCVKYTWFFWNKNSSKCECGPAFGGQIQCNRELQEVWMRVFSCMTYDNSTRSTTAAFCPFGVFHEMKLEDHFVHLPKLRHELNDAVCGKAHREGLLCSKCKPGYGPSVLSYGYPCAKCSVFTVGSSTFLLHSFQLLPFFSLLRCVKSTLHFLHSTFLSSYVKVSLLIFHCTPLSSHIVAHFPAYSLVYV